MRCLRLGDQLAHDLGVQVHAVDLPVDGPPHSSGILKLSLAACRLPIRTTLAAEVVVPALEPLRRRSRPWVPGRRARSAGTGSRLGCRLSVPRTGSAADERARSRVAPSRRRRPAGGRIPSASAAARAAARATGRGPRRGQKSSPRRTTPSGSIHARRSRSARAVGDRRRRAEAAAGVLDDPGCSCAANAALSRWWPAGSPPAAGGRGADRDRPRSAVPRSASRAPRPAAVGQRVAVRASSASVIATIRTPGSAPPAASREKGRRPGARASEAGSSPTTSAGEEREQHARERVAPALARRAAVADPGAASPHSQLPMIRNGDQ